MIEEAGARAQEGSTKVEQLAGSIAAITESVSRVKGLVEEVSVASRQQAPGIDQVTQAVAQMEKVTQSTAATAEESAAASKELSAQAEYALEVVARLQKLVSGTTREATLTQATVAEWREPQPLPQAITMSKLSARPGSAEAAVPRERTGTFDRF